MSPQPTHKPNDDFLRRMAEDSWERRRQAGMRHAPCEHVWAMMGYTLGKGDSCGTVLFRCDVCGLEINTTISTIGAYVIQNR